MNSPSQTAPEKSRIEALRQFEQLNTISEHALDDLTSLTANVCKVPIALISLIDREKVWVKSSFGLDVKEIPREVAICSHMVEQTDLLIVSDTLSDKRFAAHPLVTGDPKIRFYAGAPLITSKGHVLGSLCIIGQEPRDLSELEADTLRVLSRQVMAQFELSSQSREIAENEARLSLALEAAKLGTFDWDIASGLLLWSRKHEELWGYEPGTFDGTFEGFSSRLHPDDRTACTNEIDRCMVEHLPFNKEFRVVWPDETVHWISASGEFAYAADGTPEKMRGVVVEVSERREAESQLLLRNEALEHSLNGFDIVNSDGEFVYVNRAYLELWGYESLEEVIQTKPADHCVDKTIPEQFITTLKEKGEHTLQFTALRKDGSTFEAHMSTRLLHDADGRELYTGSTLDVTEQKNAHNAIRRSREQLSSIIDSVDGIVWEADPRTFQFTFVSPRAERLLGFPASRWIEEPDFWPNQIHPEDRDVALRTCKASTEKEEDHEFEYRMVDSEGNSVWIRDIVSVVTEEGLPTMLRGVMVDVTEQKKAEERIRRLNRTYAVLSDIHQVILRETEPRAFLTSACRSAVDIGEFEIAWIGMKDESDDSLKIVAHAGLDEKTLELLSTLLGDAQTEPACYFTLQALREGVSGVCNDINADPKTVLWNHETTKLGIHSVASLPLKSGPDEMVIGTLNLYSSEKEFFDEDEVNLLSELAHDLSFALEFRKREQERHEISKALKRSEAQLSSALKIARLGYWEYDTVNDSLLFNDRVYELFRTSPEKEGGYQMSISRFVERYIHPEDISIVEEESRKVFESTDPDYSSYYEHRLILGDGSIGHFAVRLFAEKDSEGNTVRTYGVNQDITERKLAEENINRVHRRYRALIDHSADIISLIDADHNILYTSPSVHSIEGFAPEELTEHNFLESIHPEDQDSFQEALKEIASNPGASIDISWRSQHKDGRWLWLEGVATNLLEDTAVGAIVANYRDITARKQLEEELRQSQKLDAIGQLAGGVAHDFNNILTIIHGYGSLLLMEDDFTAENAESVNQIIQASERAANLTRQLLAFSRRQVMQPRPLDLNDSVNSLTKMLYRIVGEDISLDLQLDPDKLMTRADAGMLDQILLNLVVNARDAMPDGGNLEIHTGRKELSVDEASRIPDTFPGCYVYLRVSDNGTGITKEIRSRIFEPFFTTKEQGKGTGLGLATVFGIVKQHNGSLTVESEEQQGTTFQILLPAFTASEDSQKSERNKAIPKGGQEVILLVEDEAPVRNLVRIILERSGYKILEAHHGVEALQVWEENRDSIQLLLTDIVMPRGISGLELASTLAEKDPNLRVVFMSGYSADIAGRELSLKEGQNFIQKPASRDQLLEIVRSSLDE